MTAERCQTSSDRAPSISGASDGSIRVAMIDFGAAPMSTGATGSAAIAAPNEVAANTPVQSAKRNAWVKR